MTIMMSMMTNYDLVVSTVRDRIWIPTSEPIPRGPLDTTRQAGVGVSGIELPTYSMHHYLRSVHGFLKVGPICKAFATFICLAAGFGKV